jgi:hypothetical protein
VMQHGQCKRLGIWVPLDEIAYKIKIP